MQIGELAKKAGVTTRTIRYYEELNLLGPREKKQEGKCNYSYDDNDFARLKKIECLKKIGLSLEEIGEIIPLYFNTPTGIEGSQALLRILTAHMQETDQKIEALQQFRSDLAAKIALVKQNIERKQNTHNA